MAKQGYKLSEDAARRIIKQTRKAENTPTHGGTPGPGRRPDDDRWFWGKIVGTGPNEEVDFTDHRYWFKKVYLSTEGPGDITDTAAAEFTEFPEDDPAAVWAYCTNQVEALAQSHTLQPDLIVRVYYGWDASSPPVVRYNIIVGGDGPFFAKITGSTSIGDNRWIYTFIQQERERDGLWKDLTDGLTGEAFNTIEANNSSSGIQGNSVDLATLPGTYSIQPVRGSPVVVMWRGTDCDGNPQFDFQYENAVQGECD